MSKSLGNILDPIEIINSFGVDQLRYYLVKEVSLGNDGSVSMENLKNCINNDLANNYGNLCQRVFSFIKKNCSNKIPKKNKLMFQDKKLLEELKNNIPNLIKLMNTQKLNEYIKLVVSFSFDANKYFNDSEPWSLKNKDPLRMETILHTISEQIRSISILLNPIIPEATGKILDLMNVEKENRLISSITISDSVNTEEELGHLEILFKKVENDN